MADEDKEIKEYRAGSASSSAGRSQGGTGDGYFDNIEVAEDDDYYQDEYTPAVASPPSRNIILIVVIALIGLFLLYSFFFSEGEKPPPPPEQPRMSDLGDDLTLPPPPEARPTPRPIPTPPPPPLPPPVTRPTKIPSLKAPELEEPPFKQITAAERAKRIKSPMVAGGGIRRAFGGRGSSGGSGSASSSSGTSGAGGSSNARNASSEANSAILNQKIDNNEGFNPDVYSGTDNDSDPNLSFADNFFNNPATVPHAKARKLGNLRRMIIQGKLIDTVLETPINTEIPGMVRAIVSRNVYSENGKFVLIPKGSRLVGTYNSSILRGNRRVNVIWSRLIRPDGIDIMLRSPATDRLGAAGATGLVDNKYLETFGNALLISALNIGIGAFSDEVFGTERTTNQSTSNTRVTTDATTEAALSAVDLFSNTAQSLVSEFIGSRPAILVPQGSQVKAFVNRDLLFPKSVVSQIDLFNRKDEQ